MSDCQALPDPAGQLVARTFAGLGRRRPSLIQQQDSCPVGSVSHHPSNALIDSLQSQQSRWPLMLTASNIMDCELTAMTTQHTDAS